MVRSASSVDDALAWWSIRGLISAIEQLPVAASSSQTSLVRAQPSPTQPHLRDLSQDEEGPALSSPSPVVAQDEASAPTVESRVLTLPRGSLLLTLTSLLPSVNFVLFRSLLAEISRLVDLEPSEHDGRQALGQWTFEVLGTGMDVVKREEGVRWWMEHGRSLLRGEKVDMAQEETGITEDKSPEKTATSTAKEEVQG